jgi:oligopeptide transport system substrate-binding protein
MNCQISRRTLLTGGPFTLAACRTAQGAYFGKTDPPSSQRLIYLIGSEPGSLDPGKTTGGYEWVVVPSLFEGLTIEHPATAKPIAALATHYEVNANFTRYTFYLRGHPRPRGMKLGNTDTLRLEYQSGFLKQDFSRGRSAPPDSLPARWSDGRIITASDFVYSWQRVVDPETATPQYGYFLFDVENAEQISAGKMPLRSLGVRSLDEFTFQIDLRVPTPYFLQLTSRCILAAAPQHAIEAARARGMEASWLEPQHVITSGAFVLRDHRPYDRIVVTKNPRYYEFGLVALDEITFLPVSDATTSLNLYKTGSAHAMTGDRLPPWLSPTVQQKRDAYAAPALFHMHPFFNCIKPPFNNVLARYALNMATDKLEIARMFGRGRAPARTFVPPFDGYEPPASIIVQIGGRTYDVLSYDPAGARELLAQAGYQNGVGRDGRALSFTYRFPNLPHSQPMAEVLQKQWSRNLCIAVNLVKQELTPYIYTLLSGEFEVAEDGCGNDYRDPNAFLGLFVTGAPLGFTWSDAAYDGALNEANSTPDPAGRMLKLRRCEAYLLHHMPIVPLLFYGYAGFQKPYVRGLATNLLDTHPFKYTWIDTNWRPS